MASFLCAIFLCHNCIQFSQGTDFCYFKEVVRAGCDFEGLTDELAEKALQLFKEIEKGGGFLQQLKEGIIQKKIKESAEKEQQLFDSATLKLLGTNYHPNKNDRMKHDLELFPFVKHNPVKTLIVPIIEKRLAENMEQERLKTEQ